MAQTIKKKRYPFKCNFCGGDLMLFQIFISEVLLKQLREVCQTNATDVFKVQKCKKCGRTYIWAEPPCSDEEAKQ